MPTQETDPTKPFGPKYKKYCTYCGDQKLAELNFDHESGSADGYRNVCKQCRSNIREAQIAVRKTQAVQDLQEQSIEVLEKLANEGGSFAPHCAEGLEAMMEPFGGVRGWSKHLFADYLAAPVGSARRLSFHRMMVQVMLEVSKQDLAEKRLEMLEDADVLREMRKHLENFQSTTDLPGAMPTPDGGVITIGEGVQ